MYWWNEKIINQISNLKQSESQSYNSEIRERNIENCKSKWFICVKWLQSFDVVVYNMKVYYTYDGLMDVDQTQEKERKERRSQNWLQIDRNHYKLMINVID